MVKDITFNDDYVCFFKKQKLTFKNITLLVGDQGCGKSTLLGILNSELRKDNRCKDFNINFLDNSKKHVYFLSTEKDNPRTKELSINNSEEYLYGLTSHFKSHGEILSPIVNNITEFKDSIILIDEPETALSLRNQYKFIETVKKCLENNNQIILATHCLIFIQEFKNNILSLEDMKYVSYTNFLKKQKQESNWKYIRDDKIIKKEKCKLGHECTCANNTGWYDNKCPNYINRRG